MYYFPLSNYVHLLNFLTGPLITLIAPQQANKRLLHRFCGGKNVFPLQFYLINTQEVRFLYPVKIRKLRFRIFK